MEAAEKALEESYKTITTEETHKSKQFVSLNQHLQSQTEKLNAFNRIKNIPTAKEKEEIRRPTVKNFHRLLDSLMNYNEVHVTMLFYPKKRINIGPKAVFMPEASPKVIYDYYVHGLVDTIYINGETLKELQEFPLKVQSIIKGYKEIFAKGRELFLKIRSSYPIFDKEQKLLVPSITVAQLGVSPDKDEKIECAPPTIDDLVYSFMEVLAGSSKIGIGPRQKDKIKNNYCSKSLLINSKFQERIDKVQLKVLSDFEDQIVLFSGLLAPLPEDLKQQLCSYMTRNTRHHVPSRNYMRSNADDVSKVAKSVFVTNFPESVSARDLWKSCSVYGTVVDVFIPSKKSKAGKRFAFVRFIKLFNLDRLVENLCTI
nr:hypothetical protein [Tanacetum cinerariifolium]